MNWRTNMPWEVNTWTRPLPLSETYTAPSDPTAILAAKKLGYAGSVVMNLNCPGPEPGLPHCRSSLPSGDNTDTRWAPSVRYRLPSGPIARWRGLLRPTEAALCRAMIWNGTGDACALAPGSLGADSGADIGGPQAVVPNAPSTPAVAITASFAVID